MPAIPAVPDPHPFVISQLVMYFNRNGYVRWPNAARRRATPRDYKKGYEVRLVAMSEAELKMIRFLLTEAGFELKNPFSKLDHWRQPIYGKKAVERFLAMVGHPATASREEVLPQINAD